MNFCLLLVLALFTLQSQALRPQEIVAGPPGMNNTIVYSGYLDTHANDRKLHYVFVQAQKNPDTAPLTIWLNGGPGCSSLIGFLQEIGPYLAIEFGKPLVKNENRWNKASNILFIQSPGYVGFSTDKNPNVTYTDRQTADDAFQAIKDFIWNSASEFKNRALFIAGESYAGKYIPDITVRIIDHNRLENATYINLKGILIGNPIMNHANNSLYKNRIQFMIDQNFVSERLLKVYQSACHLDFLSPRCQYFKYQFDLLRKNLNYYYVYEVCEPGQTENWVTDNFIEKVQKKLKQLPKDQSDTEKSQSLNSNLKQIPKCPSDDGMIDYLNYYKVIYHVEKVNKTWAPCNDSFPYEITVEASMEQFRQIFLNKAIKVWLYSADWDDVVPYPDTVYNLNLLGRKKQGHQEPWFIGEIHAGFYQLYDALTLITVKGAGHQVPTYKPAAAYQIFYNFINNKPINTPVSISEQKEVQI